MSIVSKVKEKAAHLQLKKELQRQSGRTSKVCNLKAARSIGILTVVEDKVDYNVLKNYIRVLKDEYNVKEVFAVGYIPMKEEPGFIQSRIDFDYFTAKDLNWQLKTNKSSIQNFEATPYDILIDLTQEECLPLRHVLLASAAQFKVGPYSDANEAYYDLMIDSKNLTLNKFSEQINHYLNIINTP